MADQDTYDVLIIGGGPCGLAVAARLCETTPSALFTDDEHQRYHWIRRHSGRMAVKNRKNGSISQVSRPCKPRYSTLVLDSSGDEWLARWTRLFSVFNIENLRSPMFFHLDPRDRDALLAYMHREERLNECCEIVGCVGKEKSKHRKKVDRRNTRPRGPTVDERDRKDYYTPSTNLFADQCSDIIHHYCLHDGILKQETVEDLDYATCEDDQGERLFTVSTNKQIYKARTVVLAIGPGNSPKIPGCGSGQQFEGACHAMQIQKFPYPSLQSKIKRRQDTNVLVIGGGLTSAQIADLAIRRGVTKVWLMMRSQLKVKPFDLGPEWLGKFRNVEQATFWSSDSDEERLQQIQSARNGGSITPKFYKVLKAHEARGNLSMLTNTTVEAKLFDATSQTWNVETQPAVELPPIDYIYYATGIHSDVQTIPFLRTLREKYPIKSYGGLPCINDDLMWNDEVPLFVTGRLGGLRIGPGAANLGGAQSGAERIAWSISGLLDKEDNTSPENDMYRLGIGNKYSPLERLDSAVAGLDELEVVG